jgi:transcriptional regulator with XRE-family HTH domain
VQVAVRTSGSILREARLRAGLSQVELSERCGKDRAQIARWERDVVMPGFETLVELVRACGFEVSLDLVTPDEADYPVLDETVRLTPKERLDRMLSRRSTPLGGADERS